MSIMAYTPPARVNILGTIALLLVVLGGIAGAVAILVAPIAILVSLALLVAAFTLSIVGLTQRFASKATSIVALVLSVILGAVSPLGAGVDTVTYLLLRHPSAAELSAHMMDYATVTFPNTMLAPDKTVAEMQNTFDARAAQIVKAGADCTNVVDPSDGRGLKAVSREACRWYLNGGRSYGE